MTRLALAIVAVTLLIFAPGGTKAGGRFDTKLSKDQQILQAVNRLTFGPRPGDVEEVRRLGVDKWVDLQLHPERIPENPVLDEKLKPLETLRMEPGEIIAAYPQNNPALMFRPDAVERAAFAGADTADSEQYCRGTQGGAGRTRLRKNANRF